MASRIIFSLLVLYVFAVPFCIAADVSVGKLTADDVQGTVKGKKILSFMDEFYMSPASKIASMIDRMQDVEMDGICINFFPDYKTNKSGMMYRWWGMKPCTYEMFEKEIDTYKSIKWGRYTDNFIWTGTTSVHVGRTPYNWFSEEETATLLKNTELLGRIAKEIGCVGIILDTEQYGGDDWGPWMMPFSYKGYCSMYKYDPTQPDRMRSFDECAQMVRKRGAQWITALTKYYPDIKIFSFCGVYSGVINSVVRLADPSTDDPHSDYRLQAAFFDGVLEAAPAGVQLIDGRESEGYFAMEYRDFLYGRDMALRRALKLTSLPEQYKKRITYAAADWPDADMVWDLDNVKKNYMTPLQFEHTLYNAMAASDEYVWLWSNGAYFFPDKIGPNLQKYRRAFARARKPHALDWKQGKSFTGYDSPEVAHYFDFQMLDDLLTRTEEIAVLPEDGWRFMADPFRVGEEKKQFVGIKRGYFRKDYDDSKWPEIKIGQVWEKQGYPDLNGSGWYRKTIKFPEFDENKKIYLYFGAVDESAWLYIDGKLVAWHEQRPSKVWDKPFALEITGSVKPGATHQVTIRVRDVSNAGGIWKPVKIIVEK